MPLVFLQGQRTISWKGRICGLCFEGGGNENKPVLRHTDEREVWC